MEITNKLKERFCKDCNIPIKIFREPYFLDRIMLYDHFYGCKEQYTTFVDALKERYSSEQEYFEDYNRVKDYAINEIKESKGYQQFNSIDMQQYAVPNTGFPSKDIYKPSFIGNTFISIDMKQANFTALHYFDPISIFKGANTWEEFIGVYTDNPHIISSKYIRQVIMGNNNPKRQVTYEKYLTYQLLQKILLAFQSDTIAFFSNDEIVINVSASTDYGIALEVVNEILEDHPVPFKAELFTLIKIEGTDGYIRRIIDKYGQFVKYDFKCLNSFTAPMVFREILEHRFDDMDKVFYHEGLICKFIEVPRITFTPSL